MGLAKTCHNNPMAFPWPKHMGLKGSDMPVTSRSLPSFLKRSHRSVTLCIDLIRGTRGSQLKQLGALGDAEGSG